MLVRLSIDCATAPTFTNRNRKMNIIGEGRKKLGEE